MKFRAANLILFLLALVARAEQLRPPAASPVISRSGQFIVFKLDDAVPAAVVPPELARLEPNLLAVSCERIKQTMLNLLDVPDQWRGKIRVVLHPFHAADEDIVVTSERFTDGWNYRIDLPDALETPRFVRALSQVLLIEIANRNAHDQSARLPPWLSEGLPPLLIAATDLELVLPAAFAVGGNIPSRTVVRDTRPADPLKQARQMLGDRLPLSVEQLSRAPAGTDVEAFRSSAIIFIHELLQLKNGGRCLVAMLPELPWDPDWRVAFLKAFNGHFRKEVDLAKWWSLQSMHIAARTPSKRWSREESLNKLSEILRCPIEVQVATNDEPFHTDVPLQSVIKGWELPRQSVMLRDKLSQLAAVKFRATTDIAGLVEQYRQVLDTYLRKASGAESGDSGNHTLFGRQSSPGKEMHQTRPPTDLEPLVKETLAQLEVLDQRREAWRGLSRKEPAIAP